MLAEISGTENFSSWIPLLHRSGIRLAVFGAGTNFAGADTVLADILFLKSADSSCRRENGVVTAGAGCILRSLLRTMREGGYGGAAGISGIPGTLGGALFMNAGANGTCISDFLLSLRLLDLETGLVTEHDKSGFAWEYRHSGIPGNKMILSARLSFPVCTGTEAEDWEKERLRRAQAPAGRSAGSTFRNPCPGLPAGKLLEEAGMKGRTKGAFTVSPLHANWIVNEGTLPAKVSDYRALISEMKEAVFQRTSILLQTEVRFADMCSYTEKSNDSIKVLVVMGGDCSEREISLKSGANVSAALRKAGYQVRDYDIRELALTDEMTSWADIVFPVLHGGYGEDGRFQALLEKAGIPFVGPSSGACRIIMDKIESKERMKANGILTPAWCVVTEKSAPMPEGFELPLIVKPNTNGSTFGVTLVENPEDWNKALDEAFRYDTSVLVEEFIQGKEGSVSVVDGHVLPIIEIQFPGRIYDYDAKYNVNSPCRHLCPPETMNEEEQSIAKAAAKAYAVAVGAESLVRVDFIIRPSDGKVFVLEGNGLPGMTETSLLPIEAQTEGISLPELCSRLVRSALR